MEKIFGTENLLKGDSTITVDSLKKEGSYIGIYFSAHWCPPCRAFTPKLIEFYNTMKTTGRNFEIVFASSDRSQSQFDEYFGSMPWAAFPMGDDRIAKASRKFKVQGIPTFVIVDAVTGKLVCDKGRAKVMGDPQGADFPWPNPTLAALVKDVSFINHEGEKKSWADLSKNDVVGFYFSAHWCGPCRAFTPQLVKTYKHMVGNGKKFEVVFMSSDRDQSSFDGYWGEMPWMALPFSDRSKKEAFSSLFNVEGIPTFVLVDPKTNKVITDNGRAKVMGDKKGDNFPWLPQPCEQLGDGPDINSTAILTLLLDGGSAEDNKAAVAAMTAVATAKKAEWSGGKKEDDDDDDFPIDFGYGDADCGLVGPIRSFCNITKKAPVLVIVDVPNRAKYYWEGTGTPTKADIEGMVAGYIAGSLTKVGLKA